RIKTMGHQVGRQSFRNPRLRVGLGIRQDEVELYGVVVDAPVAFLETSVLADRMTVRIEPDTVVESIRLHDEGVAFPLSDRITIESRFGIRRKLARVRPYRAPRVEPGEKHESL